jgi:hypothetical protein
MNKNTNGRKLQFTGGVAAAALCVGLQAGAQTSSWTRDWTYLTVASGAVPQDVEFGNQGDKVFSSYGGVEGRTVLIDADSQNPANPDWLEIRADEPDFESVAAATNSNVYATLRIESDSTSSTGKSAILSKYSSSSLNAPDWSTTLPVDPFYFPGSSGLAVSADGSRIVAVCSTLPNITNVYEYTATSSTPTDSHTFMLGGILDSMCASADASRLYLRRGSRVRVADLSTGSLTLVASQTGDQFTGGHAMSADGRTIAYTIQDSVKVWQQNSSGNWNLTRDFPIDQASEISQRVTLSADGSVVAAGIQKFTGVKAGLVVFETGSGFIRKEKVFSGSGQYNCAVSDIDMSYDGSIAAVALWGDQNQTIPEVAIFDTQSSGDLPEATLDLDGSALSVDLSSDGSQIAVGSRNFHISQGGLVRGQIDRFSRQMDVEPDADFWIVGTPRENQTVDLHFAPEGSGRAFLLVAYNPATTPVPFGQIGTLYLQRAGLRIIRHQTFEQGEFVRMTFPITESAGTRLCFQGLSHSPRNLSESWVEVTVQD